MLSSSFLCKAKYSKVDVKYSKANLYCNAKVPYVSFPVLTGVKYIYKHPA